VSAFGLLNCVHCQSAHRVDAQLVDRAGSGGW